MGRFLLRRLLASILTLLLFAGLVFFVAKAMMPGDFTNNFMPGLSTDRPDFQEQLGLDRSTWQQFLRFMGSFVRGQFGETTEGRPISDIMFTLLPWTVLVFVLSVTLAFLFGHWLGKIVGWSTSRAWRGVIRFGAVTTHTVFPPFLTFALAYGFLSIFGRDVSGSMNHLDGVDAGSVRVGRMAIQVPSTSEAILWKLAVGFAITGLLLLAIQRPIRVRFRKKIPGLVLLVMWAVLNLTYWQLIGERSRALDILFLLSLPLLAVALLTVGEIILVVEAAMDGVSQEEYIRTARAIGLPERAVRDRHAARVALLPALSRFVVSLPFVLSGLVIVEFAFAVPRHYSATVDFPGLSSVLFASLQARDYPLVVGGLLFIGIIAVVARVGLDVLHATLDPRIRYGQSERVREVTV